MTQRRTFLICFLLALSSLALYFPATGFDFVRYDDQTYVYENAHINKGLSVPGLEWCFQMGYASNWHPLTWLSHMVDCQLYGLNPQGHHWSNILLHALNAVLVFLLLQRLTGATWRSAAAAALFALHPLHVESVAWVAERKDVLNTFFGLLSLLAYARYAADSEPRSSNARWFYFAAVLLFALALMAKPMAVTLPFLLLLLDWWPLGRFSRTPVGRLLVEKTPFVLLSAACCVVTLVAQRRGGAIQSLEISPLPVRVCGALLSYERYLGKFFFPAKLSVIYPQGLPPRWSQAVLPLCLLACISVVALLLRRTRPYFMVGWLWFLGTLIPVIGLVQVGIQTMADRYTYVPYLGLFIIICWGSYDLARNWPHRRLILGLAAALALAACAWVTSRQLSYWRDTRSLFQHAAAVLSGDDVARFRFAGYLATLGAAEQAQHDTNGALFHYRMALGFRPDFPEALNNLAWILASDADPQNRNGAEAVKLAARACELTQYKMPIDIGTLAAAEAEAGQFDEAIANAQKAHDLALALGRPEVAARNLKLLEIYRSHRPYHERR